MYVYVSFLYFDTYEIVGFETLNLSISSRKVSDKSPDSVIPNAQQY